MASQSQSQFRFKMHDIIGHADALEDQEWLEECFINNGELDILRDVEDPRCALVGRTGVGKSALLSMLRKTEDRTVSLDPESLALTYLSSESTLSFYSEIGVKMDLFYDMLWRHIIIVEVIKLHFDGGDESKIAEFLRDLRFWSKDRRKYKNAVEYLSKWSETFGEETGYRITEYTKKLETDLNKEVKGKIGASLSKLVGVDFSATRTEAQKLTEEQKAELVLYAQPVVDSLQIKDLADAVKVLEEILLTEVIQPFEK